MAFGCVILIRLWFGISSIYRGAAGCILTIITLYILQTPPWLGFPELCANNPIVMKRTMVGIVLSLIVVISDFHLPPKPSSALPEYVVFGANCVWCVLYQLYFIQVPYLYYKNGVYSVSTMIRMCFAWGLGTVGAVSNSILYGTSEFMAPLCVAMGVIYVIIIDSTYERYYGLLSKDLPSALFLGIFLSGYPIMLEGLIGFVVSFSDNVFVHIGAWGAIVSAAYYLICMLARRCLPHKVTPVVLFSTQLVGDVFTELIFINVNPRKWSFYVLLTTIMMFNISRNAGLIEDFQVWVMDKTKNNPVLRFILKTGITVFDMMINAKVELESGLDEKKESHKRHASTREHQEMKPTGFQRLTQGTFSGKARTKSSRMASRSSGRSPTGSQRDSNKSTAKDTSNKSSQDEVPSKLDEEQGVEMVSSLKSDKVPLNEGKSVRFALLASSLLVPVDETKDGESEEDSDDEEDVEDIDVEFVLTCQSFLTQILSPIIILTGVFFEILFNHLEIGTDTCTRGMTTSQRFDALIVYSITLVSKFLVFWISGVVLDFKMRYILSQMAVADPTMNDVVPGMRLSRIHVMPMPLEQIRMRTQSSDRPQQQAVPPALVVAWGETGGSGDTASMATGVNSALASPMHVSSSAMVENQPNVQEIQSGSNDKSDSEDSVEEKEDQFDRKEGLDRRQSLVDEATARRRSSTAGRRRSSVGLAIASIQSTEPVNAEFNRRLSMSMAQRRSLCLMLPSTPVMSSSSSILPLISATRGNDDDDGDDDDDGERDVPGIRRGSVVLPRKRPSNPVDLTKPMAPSSARKLSESADVETAVNNRKNSERNQGLAEDLREEIEEANDEALAAFMDYFVEHKVFLLASSLYCVFHSFQSSSLFKLHQSQA